MKTLLFLLQILAGLASLGLLGLAIVKAYRGHPTKRLSKWVIGFAVAFVMLTILVKGINQ